MNNIEKLEAFMKGESLSEVNISCIDDVEMIPVKWLWPDRIARGKITVIAGHPGLGKSQITAALSAVVSQSLPWPDGHASIEAGNAIILSSEDDVADTIKPRLVAAGANLKRCHILEGVKSSQSDGKCGVRAFDLSRDIEKLGAAVEKIGNVRLVIIDPISAYLGTTDSHNNAEIRGLLAPLSNMAAQHGFSVVLVTHLNKSKDGDIMTRITGSMGLIAAARAGFLVVKDEQNPDIRYFIPVKNNIGNDKDGFAFRIASMNLQEGIKTSKVEWLPGSVAAQKILYPESPAKHEGIKEFLQELLSNCEIPATTVFEQGQKKGYNETALHRASTKLGVIKRKAGMSNGWLWSLRKDFEGIEDCEGNTVIPGMPAPR